jgi:hypothetical protein
MFTLRDGREHFYTWDIDRQVIVKDPSITEVHFCNRTDDCSLVVEVKEEDGLRIANVPNILLQSSFDIRVFGYDGKATMHDKVFKVKARTKPADYVYTETEIKNFEELEKQIAEIKAAVDGISMNNKNTYYLDFKDATTEQQPATEEMIEFATRFLDGQNVCVYAMGTQNTGNVLKGWQPATIQKVIKSVRLILNGTDPQITSAGNNSTYYTYQIKQDSTAGWVYYKEATYRYAIATKEYVDKAIADIDIPEAEVDLTNYYNKEETNKAIQDALNAIGVAEGGAY